ncbi:hypothetical protein CASFOL_023441 [Castilleja foliolosa]|uniref:Uncharacterized protein n=1 Tax=Castilleja foliolosa TaxID=1961234 RepID=A0ABD3CLX2_9LAMI
MDAVYEELDEAKSEIEKLKEQYRVKAELAESLRRAHNDQQGKNKEASSKLEKQAQELSQKDDELYNVKQILEELKSKLKEKESIIRQVSSAYDKLRSDCSEKLRKFEDENKVLASALDDANAKSFDQEQQICALKQEIEGVKKRILISSEKKSSESNSKTKASKKSDAREDEFVKLDDEKRKFENQLKWKKEQFVHLEEAHKKLRSEFKTKEKEWEKEKNSLLDSISSLEANLDSQTRISKDLQRRFEMCNQALSHAESKRKILETQLSESRTSFDSICVEYDDAKLVFENLAAQRDQDIASLRSSLGTKDVLYKEMEYQFKKLEQEKKELLISLKELQEDKIREAGFSYSSSKLQNKLKSLEQAHKECSTNLKVKESEWQAQMEKLSEELNFCRSELKIRDTSLNELNRELEARDSLIFELELINQETSLVLLVLKSEFLDMHDNNNIMHELVEELEKKKAALNGVQKDLDNERVKVVLLSEKVQTLEALQFPLHDNNNNMHELVEELEKKKAAFNGVQKDLDNERVKVVLLSEKVQTLEALQFPLHDNNNNNMHELVEELEKKKSALDGVQKDLDDEHVKVVILSEKVQTLEALQFPLQQEVARLKEMLDESKKDLDDEQVKVVLLSEKVQTLEALQFPLQQEVVRLKETLDESKKGLERSEEQVVQIQSDFNSVRDALDRANKELDEKFCEANEIEFELQIWKSMAEQLEMNLKRNLQMRREVEASLFAQTEVELNLKQEKECLRQILEEKDKRIDNLQQQLVEVSETMNNLKMIQNAEENVALAQVEVESDKNTPETTERIYQLVEEKDQRIYDLQQLVASLEKEFESSTTSFSSKLRQMQKERNVLRESWETVKSDEVLKEMEVQENKIMIVELENDLRNLRQLVDEQEMKIREIEAELEKKELEVQKLKCELGTKIRTSDRKDEKLAKTMCLMSEKMDRISVEDVELMESLGKIVESFDISRGWASSDEYDDVKENVNVMLSSPLMKKVEDMHDERSPLRAIN